MTKVKIGIRGAYGEQNFGDDALMLFLYRWSIKNNLDIRFIGKANEYISELIPEEKYILKMEFHKYMFETLILGGGTQFFSFENSPRNTNKLELLIKNPKVFITKLFSFIEKKFIYNKPNYSQLFAVGIGLGPFVTNSDNEISAKEQIAKMQGVYVRDKNSFNFSKRINDKSFLGTDICFLPDIYDFDKHKNTSQSIKKIGIIVRDWNYSSIGQSYINSLISQSKRIINEGFDITFIFFKEELECEKIIDSHNYDKLKWNPLRMKLEDFIEELSIFDLFISARFHGVIFGALLGVPSIAIEVEPKLNVTKELLEGGVKIWAQPFETDLVKMLNNFNYVEAVESLNNAVQNQQKQAEEMLKKLYDDIS